MGSCLRSSVISATMCCCSSGSRSIPLESSLRFIWWFLVQQSAIAPSRSAHAQLLDHVGIRLDAEPRALRHGDAPVAGMDGVVQRVDGEIAIVAFDQRFPGHGRDAMYRRQKARTEVRRMRHDGYTKRLGEGHHLAHLGDTADLGDAWLRVRDRPQLEHAPEV